MRKIFVGFIFFTSFLTIVPQMGFTVPIKTETPAKRAINAFHLAARHGRVEEMNQILKTGFSIDERDFRKWTALHIAAHYGKLKAVAFLLERNADLFLRTPDDKTAYQLALDKGNTIIEKLLQERMQLSKDGHRGPLFVEDGQNN